MKQALIIGASGGIGSAVAERLRSDGTQVVGVSRSQDGLDITDEASVAHVLGQLEGKFDLVVVATGALVVNGARPEKAIAAVSASQLVDQFLVNAVGPALVLKHVMRMLPKDRRVIVAALSARVGSIGDNKIGGWHSYRASKAALNQLVRGAAIEMLRTHPHAICAALHPGTVATSFTEKYAGRHSTVSPHAAAENLLRVICGLQTADSGGFFDYAGNPVPW
jgi:NAD(P)-dependent dehydrogenase (short-subunit alcohol dehydrogenase family)